MSHTKDLLSSISRDKKCLILLGVNKFEKNWTYKTCIDEIFPEVKYFIYSDDSNPAMELIESDYLSYSIEPISIHLIQDILKLFQENSKNEKLKKILNTLFQSSPDDTLFDTNVIHQGRFIKPAVYSVLDYHYKPCENAKSVLQIIKIY